MHSLTYLALWAVVCLTSAKIIVELPAPIMAKIKPIEEQCIKETGSIPDSFNHMLGSNMSSDETTKKFIWCFESKTGYFDKNAHFDLDKFTDLTKHVTEEKEAFLNALKECNQKTGDDLVETAYQMVVCYHQNSPYAFVTPKK